MSTLALPANSEMGSGGGKSHKARTIRAAFAPRNERPGCRLGDGSCSAPWVSTYSPGRARTRRTLPVKSRKLTFSARRRSRVLRVRNGDTTRHGSDEYSPIRVLSSATARGTRRVFASTERRTLAPSGPVTSRKASGRSWDRDSRRVTRCFHPAGSRAANTRDASWTSVVSFIRFD